MAQLKTMETHLASRAALQLSTLLKDRVRRQWLQSESTFQDLIFTLAQHSTLVDVHAFAADILVRWKQIQVEEEAFVANLVQVSHDPDIKRLGHDLITLRSQLARQVLLPDAH